MPSRLRYIVECFRVIRFKKCKSSCCEVDFEASSPPNTPTIKNEENDINLKNNILTLV
jgi:hypothetical protein